MLVWALGAALAGTPHTHVRDLDPNVVPDEVGWSVRQRRLVVDGAVVRGTRIRQLDWLGRVFVDDQGQPLPSLRIAERQAALRRLNTGGGILIGTSVAVVATSILVPPAGLAVAIAAAAPTGAGLVVVAPARMRFDDRDLADQLDRIHAVDVALD